MTVDYTQKQVIKDSAGKPQTYYRCSCTVCRACWVHEYLIRKQVCIYGGINGYEHQK